MSKILAQSTFTQATGAGTIRMGCMAIECLNVGAANATIGGVIIPPNTAHDFNAILDYVYPATTYDATGTTLYIKEIRGA